MKIEFDIPDFIPPQRIIHIMAGIERIGYIMSDGKQFVKVSQCKQCGECCKKMECEYLEKEPGNNDLWRCGKGSAMPFCCSISNPRLPNCAVKYEEV